ncbi:MAG: DUF4377 domain-containing protein [Bacteroidota bacterium]
MKHIIPILLLTLLFSCENEDFEVVDLHINHHKAIAFGLHPTLVFQVQESDQIGTGNWSNFYGQIEGFEYEWGYTYDLKAIKRTINNPPADGSSIEFILKEVTSKEAVLAEDVFTIRLRSLLRGFDQIVTQDESNNYSLLNQQQINCGDLCIQLSEALTNHTEVSGVFQHGTTGEIVLNEIIIE